MRIAEGRAKDKQLLREHFRQLPDVDEQQEEAGDEDEDGGSDEDGGYDPEGGLSDDEEDNDQVNRVSSSLLCSSQRLLAEAHGSTSR